MHRHLLKTEKLGGSGLEEFGTDPIRSNLFMLDAQLDLPPTNRVGERGTISKLYDTILSFSNHSNVKLKCTWEGDLEFKYMRSLVNRL